MDFHLRSPDSQDLKFMANLLMLLLKLKGENKINLTYSGEKKNGKRDYSHLQVPREQVCPKSKKHKHIAFHLKRLLLRLKLGNKSLYP